MRIVKPLRLSLLHRVFENAGQPVLAVTGLVGFRLDEPKAIQHEVALWKAVGKAIPDGVLDELMPKTRGEVILGGSAIPVGAPRAAMAVKVSVHRGRADQAKALMVKELAVFGNRTWGMLGMSQPEPFTEMPLTFENAFGGEGHEDNPRGKGVKPIVVDGKKVHPLPNVEYRADLITSPGDKPQPATVVPCDVTHPARMRRVGTYDQKWLDTRFPFFPEDFDWEFFNVAPSDQRITGFFDGSETLRVEGMHADRERIESDLPPCVARAFIERKAEPNVLVEVPMHIDTLFLFPNMLLGVMAFRGTVQVDEDDADDVKTLVGGIDARDDLRPASHFLRIKQLREDKEAFHAEMLDDAPLVPQWFVEPSVLEDGWNDTAEHVQLEHKIMKRAEANRDKQMSELREQMLSTGLSEKQVDEMMPKIEISGGEGVPTTLGELPAAIQRSKEQIEEQQAEEEEKMRALMKERGRDYDAEKKQALVEAAGPPKTSMVREHDKMRALIEDGAARGLDVSKERTQLESVSRKRLLELDEMQVAAYRMFGHQMPEPPPLLSPTDNAERVGLALRMHQAGESLEGFDFTGADLSGVDLTGADLSKALFEAARFRGANLARTNLRDAMLGRASLDGGDFSEADLSGANLSVSTFIGARFDGARFDKTSFFESKLTGGSFESASFDNITFLKTVFGRVDLSKAMLKMASIIEADLADSTFREAFSDQLTFIRCKLDRVDFGAASLTRTSFIQSHGDGISYDAAKLDRVAFIDGCRLDNATFRAADMKHVCFRGSVFEGSDLTEASAEECDFSSADFRRAKLYKLRAPRSLFIRTDLTGADLKSSILMNSFLMKALIYGTDFRGANLFRADLSKVRGDTMTNFRDAYLAQIAVAGSMSEARARAPRPGGIR
jgi:uncharacterized protein YjbI with pentapeptide repeats